MRYRSESRYTGGGRGCQSLFPNSSTDRNSSLSSGGGGGSFVSGGACKTNGDASRVSAQPFSPRPIFIPFSSRFLALSFTRCGAICSLAYLLTFHARKPNVYYRACLAISVLYFSLPPYSRCSRERRQNKGFHSLNFRSQILQSPVSRIPTRATYRKRCYRPPPLPVEALRCLRNIARDSIRTSRSNL